MQFWFYTGTLYAKYVCMRFEWYLEKYATAVLVAAVLLFGTIPVNAGIQCSSFLSSSNNTKASSWQKFITIVKIPFKTFVNAPLVTAQSFDIPQDVLIELEMVQEYIQNYHRSQERYFNPDPTPEFFRLNQNKFNVLLKLGGGTEGQVFWVESEGQSYAIKRFYHADQMSRNLRVIRSTARRKNPIITPLAVDWSNNLVLYPFVNGIDLGYIFRPYSLGGPDKTLPISESTQKYIEKKYDVFLRSLNLSSKNNIIDNNVVLDLDNQRFIIIDPR